MPITDTDDWTKPAGPSGSSTPKASGAVDFYLNIPTAPGEATTTGFEKQIAVDAFKFDFEQTLNIGSQISGTGAGKITFNPFQIRKHYDASSPKLFMAAATGIPFQNVVFSIVKTGSGSADGKTAPKAYLTVKFGVFCVKSIDVTTVDAYPMEVIGFEYGMVSFSYSILNLQTNALTTSGTGGWDRTTNKSWNG